MAKTSIEWVCAPGYRPETWNPVRGCSRVSEGCRNCYAERLAARFCKPGEPFYEFARPGQRGAFWTGKVSLIPEKVDEPLHWREPRMVFVNSMGDLFHESLPFERIAAVYNIMAAADRHTFQVLTKRPARRLEFFRWVVSEEAWPSLGEALRISLEVSWPLPNVWEGVSVEDQQTADERIPLLLRTPAARRFVSLEPLLGPVDLRRVAPYDDFHIDALDTPDPSRRLGWVIVGGESGPRARPFDIAWARSLIQQCREATVPCFLKQAGRRVLGDATGFAVNRWLLQNAEGERCEWTPPIIGPVAGQRPKNAVGFSLFHPKGGDPKEWPTDLRVREWPIK